MEQVELWRNLTDVWRKVSVDENSQIFQIFVLKDDNEMCEHAFRQCL